MSGRIGLREERRRPLPGGTPCRRPRPPRRPRARARRAGRGGPRGGPGSSVERSTSARFAAATQRPSSRTSARRRPASRASPRRTAGCPRPPGDAGSDCQVAGRTTRARPSMSTCGLERRKAARARWCRVRLAARPTPGGRRADRGAPCTAGGSGRRALQSATCSTRSRKVGSPQWMSSNTTTRASGVRASRRTRSPQRTRAPRPVHCPRARSSRSASGPARRRPHGGASVSAIRWSATSGSSSERPRASETASSRGQYVFPPRRADIVPARRPRGPRDGQELLDKGGILPTPASPITVNR